MSNSNLIPLFKYMEFSGIFFISVRGKLLFRRTLEYNINILASITDAKILYHYISESGVRYPVYYESNNEIITKGKYAYCIKEINPKYKKDYTQINLNILK